MLYLFTFHLSLFTSPFGGAFVSASKQCQVEKRYVFIEEVILIRRDFYLIAASMFPHSRQSRFSIRLPRIERIHLVFTGAYFAQILNTIIVLIAVNMVYLLLWPATFADCPDGMVQMNMNLFLAYPAINGQVALFTKLLTSYHSAISAASQPTALSIVSVVLFYAKQQLLLLRFSQMFLVHNSFYI